MTDLTLIPKKDAPRASQRIVRDLMAIFASRLLVIFDKNTSDLEKLNEIEKYCKDMAVGDWDDISICNPQ